MMVVGVQVVKASVAGFGSFRMVYIPRAYFYFSHADTGDA
jgi:hypothetical protein